MKKIIFLLILCLMFSSCSFENNFKDNVIEDNTEKENITSPVPEGEYRAVWINYNELSMKSENGGSEESFREKTDVMFKNISEFKLNTVIVHVRPFSDSFYKSDIFPWSAYLTGRQGNAPPYDPLKIITEQAKKYNLNVEAWINPYRVSYKNSFDDLSDNNPAKIWHNENPQNDDLIEIEKGIFYNPSSRIAQKLIIDGVREIVENYEISAIHMDDYFYPTTDDGIDASQYSDYLNEGGQADLGEWRRQNVNAFVSGLYSAVKSQNPNVNVVISPAGDIKNNYNNLYADIKEWCSSTGYLDIIMPQLYYGFNNSAKPFSETAKQWEQAITGDNIKLCLGMAFYKSGKTDAYAGNGINEWCENSDICARQLNVMRSLKNYYGFAVYSYSYLFSNNMSENAEKECQNLKNMVQ